MLTETPIPAPNLRGLKTICIALPFGATLFAIIAIITGNSSFSTSDMQPEGFAALRMVHLVITLFLLAISKFLGEKILSGKIKLRTLPSSSASIDKRPSTIDPSFSQRYFSATIAQLALTELTVLFGIVIFMTGAISGAVRADSSYYLHFLPLFYFIIQAWMLYPTEEKFNDLMRQYQG